MTHQTTLFYLRAITRELGWAKRGMFVPKSRLEKLQILKRALESKLNNGAF